MGGPTPNKEGSVLPSIVVVGGFWGDEGKGKIISYLAVKDRIDVAVRGGVGPNAGHTVKIDGKKIVVRMIPSAFPNPKCKLLIGPGVLINPNVLLKEIEELNVASRVGIDYQCAIIEEEHIDRDKGSSHLSGRIGTTGSGCGPCNEDRVKRIAKLARDVDKLKKYLCDVPLEINSALDEGRKVLVEGTQGTFLSLIHGTYPYVTSKDVTASTICADVGLGPKRVDDVIVVFKSYITRVGKGPLEGEISWEEAEKRGWAEKASVTGRKRRAAPFNFKLARRAVMLNSATQVAITKMDILVPESRGIRNYDEMPAKAKEFIEKVESELKVPVTLIGVGPLINDIIDRRKELGFEI